MQKTYTIMKKIERVNYLEKLKGLRLTPDIKTIVN
jgi:hypothetical protein